jgi:hypothetical protein
MAKRAGPAAGYDAGEQKTLEYLTQLFEAANFQIQAELDLGGRAYPDMVVGREDLGRYRHYGIELALVKDSNTLKQKLNRLNQYVATAKRRHVFEEFWFVSNLSVPKGVQLRKNHPQVRAFTIKEIELMLAKLSPKAATKPKTGKAKTKVGKAVEANEREIRLAISGLILQIDAKIEALRDQRPNSPEAIAEQEANVSEYERMRAELERIQTIVEAFTKGQEKEAKVVKSVKAFAAGVQAWWDKKHAEIVTKTFDMGLFATSVGICSMAGAGGKMSVLVSAALVGGKPVAQALKGLIPKKWTGE